MTLLIVVCVCVCVCADLGIVDGHQLVVADATTPKSLTVIVKLEQKMDLQTGEEDALWPLHHSRSRTLCALFTYPVALQITVVDTTSLSHYLYQNCMCTRIYTVLELPCVLVINCIMIIIYYLLCVFNEDTSMQLQILHVNFNRPVYVNNMSFSFFAEFI